MVKLFLLYAILIFAKRAPKLITDLLKLKGDGIGLKGLNIKNKLGEAPLVGDKVKKGMMAAEGSIKKTAGGAISGFVSTKGGLSARLKGAGKGAASGIISGGREALAKGDSKGMFKGAMKDVGNIARNGEPSLWQKVKEPVQRFTGNIEGKGYNPIIQSRMKEAEEFKKRLSNMYGAANAQKMLGTLKVDFNDTSSYNNYKNNLKNMTKDPTGSYTVNGETYSANGLYTKENFLKKRNKVLSEIDVLSEQLLKAQQAGDTSLESSIRQSMTTKFDSAKKEGLFENVDALGIDAFNYGYDSKNIVIDPANPSAGRQIVTSWDPVTNAPTGYKPITVDDLRANLSNAIKETSEAASIASEEVKNSEKLPSPSGDKK